MSFTIDGNLGQGYLPYVLESISRVARENNPEDKIRIPGYLNYLYVQGARDVVSLNTADGGRRTVQIKQKQRLTEDFIVDGDGACDVTNIVPTFETSVDVDIKKSINLYLDIPTLQSYPAEQRQSVSMGTPQTIDREMFDRIKTATNALLTSVDRALLAKQAAAFGTNVRTGSNAAAAINLEKNADVNPLLDGETQLLSDWGQNENMGRPAIVGSGLVYNYFLQQGAKSANSSGVDSRFFANQFDFYYDQTAATEWGANEFAVMSPNSTQLVEYFANRGAGGRRLADSTFGTIVMPSMRGEQIVPVEFDVQIKEIDCETTFTDGYYGGSITVDRGYQMIIQKTCGLWTVPEGSYRATDYLNGNRGTYRYVATNDCTTCP